MKKTYGTVRIYKEEAEKLNRLSREISVIQNKKIPTPEIIRRTLNVPTISDILKRDAEIKRGMRR